jgi:hypothetical protein
MCQGCNIVRNIVIVLFIDAVYCGTHGRWILFKWYLSRVLCTTFDMFYILLVALLWIHGTLSKIELNWIEYMRTE